MNKNTEPPKIDRGDNRVRCCTHNLEKSVELHWHDFYEIELILGGQGMHIVNGKEYEWRRGGMYFMGMTDFHEICLNGTGQTYVIELPPRAIPAALFLTISRFDKNIVTYLSPRDFVYAEVLCDMLQEYSTDDTKNDSVVIEHIISMLLHLLFNSAGTKMATPEKGRELLNQVLAYLGDNFYKALDLTSVAVNFGISKTYLCTYFKKCMGRTVMEYVRELRLEYAAKLTRGTKLKNGEICVVCGYLSVSNFLRDFKKYHSCSPMEMRRKSLAKDKHLVINSMEEM